MKQKMESMYYPRTLILNVSFNPNEGAGITIGNLFNNWPKDRIANACFNSFYDEMKCLSYFELNPNKRKVDTPSKKKENIALDFSELKNSPLKKLFIGFKTTLEGLGLINKIRISSEFKIWVKNFNPQVIYCVAFGARDIPFLINIKKLLQIPMVLHIYDDWIEHNRYGYFEFIFSWIIKVRFKKLLKKCDGHFAISEKMADVYMARYGFQFITFHNPSNFNPQEQRQINMNKQEIKIGIFGTVGENNINEIMLLNEVANEVIGFDIQLHLYGSIRKTQMIERLASDARIVNHGLVSHDEIFTRIAECDILFLPLSFKKMNEKYFKLSMPTKYTEFLSSGVPILVFAPGDFALTEYSKKHNCAFVVSEFSKNELKKQLLTILEDYKNAKIITSNALFLYSKNHNIVNVSDRFRHSLSRFVK